MVVDKGCKVAVSDPQSLNYGRIGTVLFFYYSSNMWMVYFKEPIEVTTKDGVHSTKHLTAMFKETELTVLEDL